MALTGKQKKYIKKNLYTKGLEKTALSLGIPLQEVKDYLKKRWSKNKYRKFLIRLEDTGKHKPYPPMTTTKFSKNKFNLKQWLIRNSFALGGLTILVLIAYFNSLSNEFVSDDISGILKNPNLDHVKYVLNNPFSFFHAILPYLVNKLFGKVPTPYRLVNIFSHLGATLTLYFLLSLLYLKKKTAFFAASIFAVHPILTESITWISGGYYSLSTFLILFSFSTYVLSTNSKKSKSYVLSIIFYFLALATSEKVIAFPFVLFLYEAFFASLKKRWKKLIPFFVLSAIWGLYLLRAFGIRTVALEESFYQKQPASSLNVSQKIVNFVRLLSVAITSYLGLIFWPDKLTLYHSEMTFSQAEYLAKFFILLATIVAAIWFYKKDQRIFFWLSFFFIALSPTLTPFGVSWIVAERYVYLASIGIFVVTAIGVEKLSKTFKNKNLPWLILAFILPALTIRTIIRNNDWKDQDHLWIAAAKTSPSSPQNHNNLGDMYGRHGNLDKAVEEFKKAIALNPKYADAYHNLANIYIGKKDIDKAIKNYQLAIKFNPRLWQSYQSLAIIYFQKQDAVLAETYLKKAIAINPQNSNLYTNLSIMYLKTGKKDQAKQQLLIALQIDPENQQAKQLLLSID